MPVFRHSVETVSISGKMTIVTLYSSIGVREWAHSVRFYAKFKLHRYKVKLSPRGSRKTPKPLILANFQIWELLYPLFFPMRAKCGIREHWSNGVLYNFVLCQISFWSVWYCMSPLQSDKNEIWSKFELSRSVPTHWPIGAKFSVRE